MDCNIALEELKSDSKLVTERENFLYCKSCGKTIGQHKRETREFIMIGEFLIRRKNINRVKIGTLNSDKIYINFMNNDRPIEYQCTDNAQAIAEFYRILNELS